MKTTLTNHQITQELFRWLGGQATQLGLPHFQAALAESEEELPTQFCRDIGIPDHSTVGHAVRCLVPLFIDGVEHRFRAPIPFRDEDESLRWWRATEGTERWDIKHVDADKWSITFEGVQPID